ncbi:MAG: hypothetical protein M3Y08_01300 [Fibrobacterota bacterium]|nr:hypothetical protein [Fibrobacterota bacterium]
MTETIDFTSAALASHVIAPGSNSIVQANLLECSIGSDGESYYGLTETVSYAREVYIKMDMKFGTAFDFGQGQKIMRVRAFNVGGGVNYWDFIAQITSAGTSAQQAGTTESYQITFSRNSGSTWGVVNKTFVRQQWYTFQYRYYLNSAQGVADGTFQCWLDGTLIANYTNLDLIGAGTWNNTINRILWGGWYSNGAGGNPNPNPSPSPATYQIRNAKRSDIYIVDVAASEATVNPSSGGGKARRAFKSWDQRQREREAQMRPKPAPAPKPKPKPSPTPKRAPETPKPLKAPDASAYIQRAMSRPWRAT